MHCKWSYGTGTVALLVLLGMTPAWANQAPSDPDDSHLAQQCPAAATWIAAMQRKEAAPPASDNIRPSKPALRSELARRANADQQARERAFGSGGTVVKEDAQRMIAVDAENLAWLRPLVQAHGFPTEAEVGTDGVENAWLLVQHADEDPLFQASVLALLKDRAGTDAIPLHMYALLEDRVRLAQGKEQLYGSQITVRDGAYVLKPTEDMAQLDARRKSMKLMPIDDYLCVIKASYGAPSEVASKE